MAKKKEKQSQGVAEIEKNGLGNRRRRRRKVLSSTNQYHTIQLNSMRSPQFLVVLVFGSIRSSVDTEELDQTTMVNCPSSLMGCFFRFPETWPQTQTPTLPRRG